MAERLNHRRANPPLFGEPFIRSAGKNGEMPPVCAGGIFVVAESATCERKGRVCGGVLAAQEERGCAGRFGARSIAAPRCRGSLCAPGVRVASAWRPCRVLRAPGGRLAVVLAAVHICPDHNQKAHTGEGSRHFHLSYARPATSSSPCGIPASHRARSRPRDATTCGSDTPARCRGRGFGFPDRAQAT